MKNSNPILDKMDSYTDGWKKSKDARFIFLSCYRMMTANMLDAIENSAFEDPEWVETLLSRFSEYYFEGLECYECQNTTPEVWKYVHHKTQTEKLHDVQCLLMGVNAHINYDLVLTLHEMLHDSWDHLPENVQKVRYDDYTRVNEIISATIDQVQDDLLEPSSTVLKVIDVAFGRLDEYLISVIVSGWRETVWNNAMKLIAIKDTSEKENFRLQIESEVLHRGKLMAMD